jgi:hypothetical protein
VAWRDDRYKDKKKDKQEEKFEVCNSEADKSTLHRASGSEDARFHQLQGASIDPDGVGCAITTAISTGEGWPATAADRSPDSMINNTLFQKINIEFMYVTCTLPVLKKQYFLKNYLYKLLIIFYK